MTDAPLPGAARAAAEDLERVLARLEWTLLDFQQREVPAGAALALAAGRVPFH